MCIEIIDKFTIEYPSTIGGGIEITFRRIHFLNLPIRRDRDQLILHLINNILSRGSSVIVGNTNAVRLGVGTNVEVGDIGDDVERIVVEVGAVMFVGRKVGVTRGCVDEQAVINIIPARMNTIFEIALFPAINPPISSEAIHPIIYNCPSLEELDHV